MSTWLLGKRRIQQLAKLETSRIFDTPKVNYREQNLELIFNCEKEVQCDFSLSESDLAFLDFSYIIPDSEPKNLDVSETDNSFDIVYELKTWASECSVNQKQFTSLLKILKNHPCFENMPSDCRSLLSVQSKLVPKEIMPGKYLHFGLRRQLDLLSATENEIQLQVNIDGLPIFKSSVLQFWPILGYFVNISTSPFVIGLYLGKQKPSDVNSFLEDFVSEFNELKSEMKNNNKSLKIHSFVCDAPAKSYIKCVKGHTGYFGCDKCEIEGSHTNSRMSFPTQTSLPRTDARFRNKINPEHHTGTTILETIPDLDMIEHFPCEYMHLVALGVVKKLLHVWVDEKPGPHKLSGLQLRKLSDMIIIKSSETVLEFSRKPRGLGDLPRWKATEFRQFLLYVGPVVLKNCVSPDDYKLFLSLFVAVLILANPATYIKMNSYAESLLSFFVNGYGKLYGSDQVSYNVHCLSHLASDSMRLGPVDNYSAFKFENHLYKIKKMVITPKYPLIQVGHKIIQPEYFREKSKISYFPTFPFSREHNSGPYLCGISCGMQFSSIEFGDSVLRCHRLRDSYFLTKSLILCSLRNICFDDIKKEYVLLVHIQTEKKPLFLEPCDSSLFNIFTFPEFPASCEIHCMHIGDILCKCQVFWADGELCVFPLLHCSSSK